MTLTLDMVITKRLGGIPHDMVAQLWRATESLARDQNATLRDRELARKRLNMSLYRVRRDSENATHTDEHRRYLADLAARIAAGDFAVRGPACAAEGIH